MGVDCSSSCGSAAAAAALAESTMSRPGARGTPAAVSHGRAFRRSAPTTLVACIAVASASPPCGGVS
eukprot:4785416-Alexandrium_andersonii.AAC.1